MCLNKTHSKANCYTHQSQDKLLRKKDEDWAECMSTWAIWDAEPGKVRDESVSTVSGRRTVGEAATEVKVQSFSPPSAHPPKHRETRPLCTSDATVHTGRSALIL